MTPFALAALILRYEESIFTVHISGREIRPRGKVRSDFILIESSPHFLADSRLC